jgi:hypothetical protein
MITGTARSASPDRGSYAGNAAACHNDGLGLGSSRGAPGVAG